MQDVAVLDEDVDVSLPTRSESSRGDLAERHPLEHERGDSRFVQCPDCLHCILCAGQCRGRAVDCDVMHCSHYRVRKQGRKGSIIYEMLNLVNTDCVDEAVIE